MNKTSVGYAVGKLLQVMGLVLLIPLAIAIYDNWPLTLASIFATSELSGTLTAAILALVAGSLSVVFFRSGRNLQGIKEGYAIVAIGWVVLTLVSCIPLLFYFVNLRGGGIAGFFPAFTDSFFEIMSGFTTTGASILEDIESVPDSLLFLRSMTQWLGGMGIITLAMTIFPAMGVSGYQMFRSEVPGPTKEKLQPRLAQTAAVLWGVYVLLSGIETMLLWAGGMNLFDAVCHTFATMATGGFSTRNASIAAFDSAFIEWVITIFMFFAGINFLLHFRVFRGDFACLKRNSEFKFYAGVVLVCVVLVAIVLSFGGLAPLENSADHFRAQQMTEQEFAVHYEEQQQELSSFWSTLRIAAFQVVSIVTTTGFVTADFDLWFDFLRIMLVLLMFFGGCAGSTGGGMKMIRIMVVAKVAFNELRKLAQPRLVSPVKIGKEPIDDSRIINIVSFFILFMGLFVLTGLLLTLFMPDLTTAFSCSIAAIGNIGPGLAGVGAIENYAWIPIPAKWLLIVTMLLGRLEIFTILILLRARAWRK